MTTLARRTEDKLSAFRKSIWRWVRASCTFFPSPTPGKRSHLPESIAARMWIAPFSVSTHLRLAQALKRSRCSWVSARNSEQWISGQSCGGCCLSEGSMEGAEASQGEGKSSVSSEGHVAEPAVVRAVRPHRPRYNNTR
ncbi:hypothetical protein KQX54_004176 [Cotesia glomerata]|uniref:Uncharacterized protein n=1 Tax=Cotesia glomerata TaxID=32391 RepID=A0AAV7HR13_COTGL|nr:hypothetical protein KQX54_004176 [Cotesia glomerata]